VKRFAKVLGFVPLSLLSALAGFVAASASMLTSGLTVPLAAALTFGAVRSLQAAAHVPRITSLVFTRASVKLSADVNAACPTWRKLSFSGATVLVNSEVGTAAWMLLQTVAAVAVFRSSAWLRLPQPVSKAANRQSTASVRVRMVPPWRGQTAPDNALIAYQPAQSKIKPRSRTAPCLAACRTERFVRAGRWGAVGCCEHRVSSDIPIT
jgi:hypothetical protein